MLIGYARPAIDQPIASQQRALLAAGCLMEDVFQETTADSREARRCAVDRLKAHDVLVVHSLDRLGRSLFDLASLVQQIEEKGAGFRSLLEKIDTTTNEGRAVFRLFAALADFERCLIAERTRAGLAAARRDGRQLGRPPSLTLEQLRHAEILIKAGQGAERAAKSLGVHPATLRRHRAKAKTGCARGDGE